MSEMLKRVGAAILEAESRWTPKAGEPKERVMARAAIEAMREPTQTMEYAGGIKCEEMMFGGDADYTGVIFKDMGTVWRTMADAALTEPTSAPGTE